MALTRYPVEEMKRLFIERELEEIVAVEALWLALNGTALREEPGHERFIQLARLYAEHQVEANQDNGDDLG